MPRSRPAPSKKIHRPRPSAGHARPPLERMLRIHQALTAGEYPNASTLARILEVSAKSVHRDLEFMMDRLGLPIEYVPARFGYRYTEEVQSFPTLQMSEGELFALMVAEKALQQYRGTPFERPLLSAFSKMAQSLPETVSVNLGDWCKSISFRTTAEPIVHANIFATLARAVTRRRRLSMRYRKPGAKTPESRVIDPIHVANINGEWYLFAFDHWRQALRTFSPARIESLEETGESFKPPAAFSLEKRLSGSFGVHSPEGNFEVVLRADAVVADYIREKRWHPSQELVERSGETLEVRMRLSSLAEIERWILGWGGRVEVLSPTALRASVAQAAHRLMDAHRS
ncbi:MAG: WYL domain-containing protein [Verrucomicrobia bacterium]|nr:WYL domain-containing protein [Verrucomicrobiota bacterium]